MNEREAIKFEMEMLKEESRRDFEMYFELRKQSRQRMEQLQNRLRAIDERDANPTYKSVNIPSSRYNIAKSSHLSVNELMVDKYAEPTNKPYNAKSKSLVPYDNVVAFVEGFLKELGEPVKLKVIKEATEKHFNVKWSNFNNVMSKVTLMSYRVKAEKGLKDYLYSYHN